MTEAGLLAWLEAQSAAVRTLVAAVDEDSLRARPAADRWSALQHLAHVARMQEVLAGRVQQILSQDQPAIAAYRAENDPEWEEWAELPLADVMTRLQEGRAELTRVLGAVSTHQWGRVGVHSTLGPMPLARWLQFFLVHEGHHVYAAMKLAPVRRSG